MQVVLASNNPGKIREFNELLTDLQFDVIPQASQGVSEIEETGLTFVENAILKARHASQVTGLPALADDSGLVVHALHGAPGIYSARFAGLKATATENNLKLLSLLENVPAPKRSAYFYCTLVYMAHALDPTPLICTGTWHGFILNATRGSGGFGYDPLFLVPAENKSAAELTRDLKNKLSHRAIALQSLLTQLPEKIKP